MSRPAPGAGAPAVTVIIPAKDEADSLDPLLGRLRALYPDYRIVVVDDGSTDHTAAVCARHGVDLITHPYNKGNGAAVKTGVRACRSDVLVLMDADRQHDPADVARLVAEIEGGFDMAVGARSWKGQASVSRGLANTVYNRLASWMVGQRISDLTSGFRAARRAYFQSFLHLLPNGFSYPATVTMAFFRAGYSVSYVPIAAGRREGRSHLRPARDGVRFLLIIFRIGTLYSPLKLFTPVSLLFFLTGLGYYLYTFAVMHRFTNMSALLLATSIIIFMIGLVSEQITALLYRDREG